MSRPKSKLRRCRKSYTESHCQGLEEKRQELRLLIRINSKPTKQFRSHPDGEPPLTRMASGLRSKTRRFRQ